MPGTREVTLSDSASGPTKPNRLIYGTVFTANPITSVLPLIAFEDQAIAS
jgi:hypothetical protein